MTWDVTQFGRRPTTDKTARRSTQAQLRDVVNVKARFRQEILSSALRDEEKVWMVRNTSVDSQSEESGKEKAWVGEIVTQQDRKMRDMKEEVFSSGRF